MLALVKVQIVQLPTEQRAQVDGATHACRHIADKLNNGERVVAGRDFIGRMQTEEWAATCRICAEETTASLRFAPEDFCSVLCLTIPITFATITPPASLRSDHLIGNPQEC